MPKSFNRTPIKEIWYKEYKIKDSKNKRTHLSTSTMYKNNERELISNSSIKSICRNSYSSEKLHDISKLPNLMSQDLKNQKLKFSNKYQKLECNFLSLLQYLKEHKKKSKIGKSVSSSHWRQTNLSSQHMKESPYANLKFFNIQ